MTDTDMENAVREYRITLANIKNLQEQAEALKNQLSQEMENRQISRLAVGEYTVHWGSYESSLLDNKKLKTDHPDLYNIYSKTVCRPYFRVT